MAELDSLPHYTVRVSRRARRVRLTVSPREGLVVVVPAGSRVDPAAIVRSKRPWAERALQRVAERHAQLNGPVDALLPDVVEVAGLTLSMPVEYRHSGSAGVSARSASGMVVLSGDVADAEKCLETLRRWLHRTASEQLPLLVRAHAGRQGLVPSSIRVGGAKTRWGSCSAGGTITLCRNSVFLPPDLLDALILHELAHLRVLDHSARFWAFLAEMDADAVRHRQQLRHAERYVPAWAYI